MFHRQQKSLHSNFYSERETFARRSLSFNTILQSGDLLNNVLKAVEPKYINRKNDKNQNRKFGSIVFAADDGNDDNHVSRSLQLLLVCARASSVLHVLLFFVCPCRYLFFLLGIAQQQQDHHC
jgi:hypothetical protein